MDLKNKNVYFLGDSITEGAGASCPENNFVSVFGRISGANVKNYGVGGTRIAKQTAKSECEKWDEDFLVRADKMDDGADVVVVFGGTNDFGHGDAEIGDMNSRDEYTFYGALHSLSNKLINKYPTAEIIFLTPLHRISEDSMVNEKGIRNQTNLLGYVEIIKEVAGFYGFPVLDLFRESGLQPKVDIIKKMYMPDGLHPSDAGAAKLANKIYSYLKAF